MHHLKSYTGALIVALALLIINSYFAVAEDKIAACMFKGIHLQGKVRVVNSFPDLKVQRVSAFPDLKVQWVKSFPDKCGKWERVDSFPDFTIQYVDSFPDLKIESVSSFPGVP